MEAGKCGERVTCLLLLFLFSWVLVGAHYTHGIAFVGGRRLLCSHAWHVGWGKAGMGISVSCDNVSIEQTTTHGSMTRAT